MIKLFKVLLFFCITTVSSQTKVVGRIIDAESKEKIAYVNLGVRNKAIGTVSNKNGYFELSLNDELLKKEKIVFSHVGYKTQEIPVSKLMNKTNLIILETNTNKIDEVVLNYKKSKSKSKNIGRKSVGLGLMHANFYTADEKTVDDRLSKEMGMIFNIKGNCKIEGLKFNITGNEFKYLKFRVNFYDIDKKLPGALLNTEEILFEIKDGYLGWYELDFNDADIYIDSEKVGVTIQWLESVKKDVDSKYFAISTAASTKKNFIQREKSMDKWYNIKASLSFYLNASCRKK